MAHRELVVGSSPHIKSAITTQRIMLDVLIALCPALIAGCVLFGPRALLLVAVCVGSCEGFEYACRRVMGRSNTLPDLSAAVTGVLLSFCLPPTLPVPMAVLGCFFAIVVVKQFFGGLGQNFANPAATARIVLMLSFTGAMTSWVEPFWYRTGADAVASATPLVGGSYTVMELLLGLHGGCIGETCGAALLLGGLYLALRRVINPVVPVVFVGTVAALTLATGRELAPALLGGGLLLGAIFMATDYATTPATTVGKAVFALGCGVLTFLIRGYGNMPEGVSFAILLMNILAPLIDRFTATRPLGTARERGRTA